jgi:hypothetical protein
MMFGKWMFNLVSKFGTIILAFYIAWLGWQHLGPHKPEAGQVRKELADKAVNDMVEMIRQNRDSIYRVVLVHFDNDPTDYFSNALRRQIESKGVLDLQDKTFIEKLRDKLSLRQPAFYSPSAAADIAKRTDADGALTGALKTFESYPGGAKIEVVYDLVSANGNIVYSGQYVKDTSSIFLQPDSGETDSHPGGWLKRVMAYILLVLLLPVFTITFIRSMVKRRSNGRNAFVLVIYTLADAVFAWFLIGLSLNGYLPLIIFLAAVAAAFAYNIRIMTFALKLEE